MIISNAEEFGKRIRERRKKLGFTQGFQQALEAAVSELSQLGFSRAEKIGEQILAYGGISKVI